jgi:DNA replication protein DnaC
VTTAAPEAPGVSWLLALRRDPRALVPPAIPRRFRGVVPPTPDLPPDEYTAFLGAALARIPSKGLRRAAVAYCKQFFDVAPEGVAPLFVGPTGTWKTYTAAFIAQRVHEVGIESVFAQTKPTFQRWDTMRFSDGRAVRHEIEQLVRVPFLVLDDFATTTPKPSWQAETLLEVLETRFSELRPTLLTGNFQLKKNDTTALDELFGVQVGRRVYHAAEGFRVAL